MPRVWLFALSCLLAGFGGAVGSILGHAFGSRGLYVGGLVGGLLAALLTAQVAVWRRWIGASQFWSTALGAGIGFLASAGVAVNTLSSPVGPVLSTVLVGTGALLGRHLSRPRAGPGSDRVA